MLLFLYFINIFKTGRNLSLRTLISCFHPQVLAAAISAPYIHIPSG